MAENYGKSWTYAEIEVVVTEYFGMLRAQITGTRYVKAEANRRVQELTGRTHGSVERKFQNISAILNQEGIDFVTGYLPLKNAQQALRDAVTARWQSQPDLEEILLVQSQQAITDLRADIQWHLIEAPHTPVVVADSRLGHRPITKVDFLELEARRRDLGLAGERAVVNLEQKKLRRRGQDRLAALVEHVSQTRGDGLGYDVRSFDEQGEELFIEVKTTRKSRHQPFMISSNEMEFSKESAERFSLYRVFDFGKPTPGLYRLPGSIEISCHLRPTQWIAHPA